MIQSDGLALASIESPPLPGASPQIRGFGGVVGQTMRRKNREKTKFHGKNCVFKGSVGAGQSNILTGLLKKFTQLFVGQLSVP